MESTAQKTKFRRHSTKNPPKTDGRSRMPLNDIVKEKQVSHGQIHPPPHVILQLFAGSESSGFLRIFADFGGVWQKVFQFYV